jgi:hypothetical protein
VSFPFIRQQAIGWRAKKHWRDLLVLVASEAASDSRDLKNQIGMRVGKLQKFVYVRLYPIQR